MKKSLIIAATILAGFSLAGCGNHHSHSKSEYKISINLKTNERGSSVKTNKNSSSRVVKNSTSSAAKSSVSRNNQSVNNDASEDHDQAGDGSGYAGCNYQDDGVDTGENNGYSYHADEESSSVPANNPQSSNNNTEPRYTTTTNQPQGTNDQSQQQ